MTTCRSSERDPRIDPIIGDGIERFFATALGGVIIREVNRSHGGFVFFRQDNGYRFLHRIVSLEKWRKWAVNSRIFKRGEEEECMPSV